MIISLILLGSINLDAVSAEMSESADKEYCYATIEDNFADDKVLVVLKTKDSLEFNDYGIEDLSDVDCKSVRLLFPKSDRIIKN